MLTAEASSFPVIPAVTRASARALVKYRLVDPSDRSSVSAAAILASARVLTSASVLSVKEITPVPLLYARSPPTEMCPLVLAAVVNRFVDPSVTLSVSISD